jgi:hypothetical protein
MNTYSYFEKKSLINQDNISIWRIVWLIFDIKEEKAIWFIYKKNFINYDYFLFEDILKLDEEKIIVNIKDKKDIINIYEIIGKTVKNEELKNIWTIEDIEFDLNFKLKSIIIDEWYNLSSLEIVNKKRISIKKWIRKFSKKYIISYEKEYIIVRDKLLIDNNKKSLENFYKIFINVWNPTYNFKK